MAVADGPAFRHVLDLLGRAIVDGGIAPGAADTVDAIAERTRVSRTAVREATRVLVSLGMLTAGRRVGLRIRPREDWDLLDPQVIRWRLESAQRTAQLDELRGLRLAVEPEAARLAAAARTARQASALATAADDLERATRDRDPVAFLAADRRFHAEILAAAGNPMLTRLRDVIDEALRESTPQLAARWRAAPEDVGLHRAVAVGVADRDGAAAAAAMRRILAGGPGRRPGAAPIMAG